MDPSTILLLASLQPGPVDRHAVAMRGLYGPVLFPLDAIPADTRAAWIVDAPDVPLETRLVAVLEAGRYNDAWRLVGGLKQPIIGSIAAPFAPWIQTECTRLALVRLSPRIAAWPGTSARIIAEAEAALDVVIDTLPLIWPRWAGPLVVMDAEPASDPMPGKLWVARPALPMLRCHAADRGPIAAELTRMTLAIAQPPPQGWPMWLRLGLAENLRQRAEGHPPSPRLMRQLRQQAGSQGINALFEAAEPDSDLAVAVCALLLRTESRQPFATLLELLRNGGTSAGAIQHAYGWTVETMREAR